MRGVGSRGRAFVAAVWGAIGAWACPAGEGPAAGVSDTAFTYQGRLDESGSPANGEYDLEVGLWDAADGGGQIGSTVAFANVPVQNGLVTLELDFGADAFDQSGRWLEVRVNGVRLMPRQPVMRTPYALQTRGIFVDQDRHVGIGTLNPNFPLHVSDDAALQSVHVSNTNPSDLFNTFGGWFEATGPLGRGIHAQATFGQGPTRAVSGHVESNGGYAAYFTGGRSYFEGSVGVGTAFPVATLDVIGFGQYAVRGTNEDNVGYGVYGSGAQAGVYGASDTFGGDGVYAANTATDGNSAGLFATNAQDAGHAIRAWSSSPTGATYGIKVEVASPDGWAGFFSGPRSYFGGRVGIGFADPSFQLHLSQNSAAKPTSNTWTVSSDARLKTDVRTIEHALDRLLALRGVRYRWKDPSTQGGMDGTYTGLIAQEVEPIFPEWISEDREGFKQLTVIGFEGLVVEALRDLRAEKDEEIARLREAKDAEIAALRERVERLEAALGRLLPEAAAEGP